MNYFEGLTPESQALIKNRERVPKSVVVKFIGCRMVSFSKVSVNIGLIRGFFSKVGVQPLFCLILFLFSFKDAI